MLFPCSQKYHLPYAILLDGINVCTSCCKQAAAGLRESVLDVIQVENMFVTPRNFNYYMGRRSGEEWLNEQQKDQNAVKSISLVDIEAGVGLHTTDQMLKSESGRVDYRKYTDEIICKEIDLVYCPKYGKSSVYTLNDEEKLMIADDLKSRWHIGMEQLTRCLVL